jgi:hypothetical protein
VPSFLKLTPPLLASTLILIGANLVPLGGALLWGWSVYDIVLLFWAENLVIGLMQVLRMGTVAVLRKLPAMLFLAGFFCFHYGLFTFVHGMFVVTMLAPPDQQAAGLAGAMGLLTAADGLLWGLLGLTASHLFSYVVNFLRGGEWRMPDPIQLMVQPYGRIVVLHLTILGGAFLALALGEAAALLALLVVLKVIMDLRAHWRQHGPQKVAGVSPDRPAPAP